MAKDCPATSVSQQPNNLPHELGSRRVPDLTNDWTRYEGILLILLHTIVLLIYCTDWSLYLVQY